MLPPTILTEAIAQVGAILILSKPENREKLIFFMGIERVRYRRPVHPGDIVEIEAVVKRLRSRMGVLSGAARVNGEVVCDGTMTFALGPEDRRRRSDSTLRAPIGGRCAMPRSAAPSRPAASVSTTPATFDARATPTSPTSSPAQIAIAVEHRRREHERADDRLRHAARPSDTAMPRVSRSGGPKSPNAATL